MLRIFLLFLFFSQNFIDFLQATSSVDEKKEDDSYPYYLSICAIFKDEGPWLKEWIEYHKLLGVQHFRLYNNDSTDNYLEVLAPYLDNGEVCLIEWPSDPAKIGKNGWVGSTQTPAFLDGIQKMRRVTKWMAIIDIDEFIVPLHYSDIPSFLKNYESFPAVVINWQCFGTSWIKDIPQGKLMIEVLTKKAPENSVHNQPVKSIVRPEYTVTDSESVIKYGEPPHTWLYLSSFQCDQEGIKKIQNNSSAFSNFQAYRSEKIDVSKVRINHYVYRTENYYLNFKIPKKERMEGIIWSQEYKYGDRSFNNVKDNAILRFVPALRERMFPSNR